MIALRRFAQQARVLGLTLALGFVGTTAHAASITFTEQLNGPILVEHDNWDWQSFSFSATANTATVDATLFKFANQGGFGNGTEVLFLKDAKGAITDMLTANVHILNSSTYSVHYEFFTDNALPSVLPHSTGSYTDVIAQRSSAYVGLQSFSHAMGVTTGAQPVPEPAALALMVLGLVAVGGATRNRKGR